MKFVSLFAGIGGLDLGLERTGHECIGQVEWADYPYAVLEKHWPDVPKIRDVKDFHGTEFGKFDLLVGGYPCQPFSKAAHSKRYGDQHEAHLWPQVHRIICNVRPSFVLLENVAGHLELGFDRVLGDLAESGYDAEWDCIPASAVGAPHRRDRVFIIAYPNDDSESDCGEHDETRLMSQVRVPFREWPDPPENLGVANGVSRRLDRLRGLGNAVVPQVAEWIGERLKEIEDDVPETPEAET